MANQDQTKNNKTTDKNKESVEEKKTPDTVKKDTEDATKVTDTQQDPVKDTTDVELATKINAMSVDARNQVSEEETPSAAVEPNEVVIAKPATPAISNGFNLANPKGISSANPAFVTPKQKASIHPSIENATKALSVTASNILHMLNDYLNNMHPTKPQDATTGARHQKSLYFILTRGLDQIDDETEFNIVFSTILDVFHRESLGTMGVKHVFRFFETIPLSKTERDIFRKMLNMFSTAADPKSRKLVSSQVDLPGAVSEGFNERSRQRILKFFRGH